MSQKFLRKRKNGRGEIEIVDDVEVLRDDRRWLILE
jgi:hypothetical protein